MIEARVAKAWVVAAICVPLVLGTHACARVSQLDMEEQPAEAAVEPVTSPASGPGDDGTEKLAPELSGIAGWVNSEPLTLAGLRGSVVLIDFWTYTCVNCIRTLQYLKDWDDRYSSAGLVIIGVHTPEFEFEKSREHVATAVESFEIRYPVAQDNDSMTWNAFGNKVWPGKYLIDGNGYIRYTHLGEGAYSETEQNIRDLLFEGGVDLGNFPAVAAPEPRLDPAAMTTLSEEGLTRELYAGYDRNRTAMSSGNSPPYFLHLEYYEFPDMDLMYEDIGERQNHYMALHGLWRNEPESIVHGRATQDHEDYIVLLFAATSVNAVMEQWAGNPYTVRVLLDGAPLRFDDAGADVKFDQEGNSYVHITSPRMYRLVDLDRFGKHELKLSSNSYEFSLFSLTFGAYEGGEPE